MIAPDEFDRLRAVETEATEESCADLVKIKSLMETIGHKEMDLRRAETIAAAARAYIKSRDNHDPTGPTCPECGQLYAALVAACDKP